MEFTLSTIITPINKIVDEWYQDGGRKFRSGKIDFDEGHSPEAKENEIESSNVLILLYSSEMEIKKEKGKLLNNYLKDMWKDIIENEIRDLPYWYQA